MIVRLFRKIGMSFAIANEDNITKSGKRNVANLAFYHHSFISPIPKYIEASVKNGGRIKKP